MSILHHDHNNEHDHELADKLTIGGFCALVAAMVIAIVIANLHLL